MQKAVITILGGLIMLAGTIMLVTPGPGLVVMALGLAVLGREYHWARRLQQRVMDKIRLNKQKKGAKEGAPDGSDKG